MWLTEEQTIDLTGYRRPSYQISWLKARGMRFFVRKDGHPRIPCSEINPTASVAEVEPNLEALEQLGYIYGDGKTT